MKKGLLAIVLPLTLSLGGCVIVAGTGDSDWDNDNWEDRQQENRFKISQLTLGADRSSVVATMGKPDFTESFTHSDKVYQVYYYRTHKNKGDGKTTKDETTAVVFVADRLFGWGEKALDQALQINNN
jgi:outer membrane protein assembly factor BamE (lipoprotein component of BamABCDE complex)